jgi:hypothetical protein
MGGDIGSGCFAFDPSFWPQTTPAGESAMARLGLAPALALETEFLRWLKLSMTASGGDIRLLISSFFVSLGAEGGAIGDAKDWWRSMVLAALVDGGELDAIAGCWSGNGRRLSLW